MSLHHAHYCRKVVGRFYATSRARGPVLAFGAVLVVIRGRTFAR